ncbi:MAG: glycoside hydrolase family 2 protein [Saccharofermentans sp.]|nr:glycoside hydrolase family 2 protein [Saccharofermentans sp.]
MCDRIYFNDDWQFEACFGSGSYVDVRLPHTVKETPFHYFDESIYQMVSGYRKSFKVDSKWQGKRLLLTFEGIAHVATVFLNGKEVANHNCGYTAFTVDISDSVIFDGDNVLEVKVDSRECVNVPPFGFVIDYMTYGGIYRDVYLDVREKTYIKDTFVYSNIADKDAEVSSEIVFSGDALIRQSYREVGSENYIDLPSDSLRKSGDKTIVKSTIKNAKIWDINNPCLYEIKTELVIDDVVIDSKVVKHGVRSAVFKKDGFYLNGSKLKLRGLNRHQSFAYTGYAMPESMQRLDARILKYELGLNAVRTSHYPQSHYFIDECDKIGLLVFTEIPGWQHIGDDEWKDVAVRNVEDMVLQYRNHASIILWGVRINESVDDDEFYKRTNEVAHKLDATRQTGGVRCYKRSNLLEDVYTYNDFSHDGKASGCEGKSKITSDINKPYLISEYNGHMFPCKAYDWENKRCEHAMRHVRVLDSVSKHEDIAGSFGWCMFDYNTHKDFGSGDRICYHGVMDMFRNSKLAGYVYACQQEDTPVLEISSTMDIGEHPGCIRGDVFIFTNADSVKMYKNDALIKEYRASDSPYEYIQHGPIRVDDYVGEALITGEGMSKAQSDAVKFLLNEAAIKGMNNLSRGTMLRGALTALRYHMKMSDAVSLYDKYVGNWGGESTIYKFEAIKNGKVVKTRLIKPMTEVRIVAEADHQVLSEKTSYDVALVRIKATDEMGNILPFFGNPISLRVEGQAELIGPSVVNLQGGMGGTYIKTIGKTGKAKLIISSSSAQEISLVFEINSANY